MKEIKSLLNNRRIMGLLLLINIFGTIYGYVWYGEQLKETPAIFIIFVPDSPTASLFFVFVLIALMMRRNWPLLEAMALVTLIKYGVWAVVMNILVLVVTGDLSWQGYMLIGSHGAMAIQGILYLPFYKIKTWHLLVASVWILHNDIIDYLFQMMPRYDVLDLYRTEIGYFTFWLSIVTIGMAYYMIREISGNRPTIIKVES